MKMVEKTQLISWKAPIKDIALIDAIIEKNFETSRSAVLHKAVREYALKNKVKV
jgi:hypothetical protein